jgi:hypothetical protein
MLTCLLSRSNRAGKKYRVTIIDPKRDTERTVHFGATGYSDYTIHRDPERMERYVQRHRARENWTRSGIYTAGFWSRWILWNKPSFAASIRDTAQRFQIQIRNQTGRRLLKREKN